MELNAAMVIINNGNTTIPDETSIIHARVRVSAHFGRLDGLFANVADLHDPVGRGYS
ncbi:MAG: hypothetical protein IPG06_25285 [Haliea sp.]|nr:hypothetical protein [Haliea sp.]